MKIHMGVDIDLVNVFPLGYRPALSPLTRTSIRPCTISTLSSWLLNSRHSSQSQGRRSQKLSPRFCFLVFRLCRGQLPIFHLMHQLARSMWVNYVYIINGMLNLFFLTAYTGNAALREWSHDLVDQQAARRAVENRGCCFRGSCEYALPWTIISPSVKSNSWCFVIYLQRSLLGRVEAID